MNLKNWLRRFRLHSSANNDKKTIPRDAGMKSAIDPSVDQWSFWIFSPSLEFHFWYYGEKNMLNRIHVSMHTVYQFGWFFLFSNIWKPVICTGIRKSYRYALVLFTLHRINKKKRSLALFKKKTHSTLAISANLLFNFFSDGERKQRYGRQKAYTFHLIFAWNSINEIISAMNRVQWRLRIFKKRKGGSTAEEWKVKDK